ncbi:MAG: hypothetical protein J6K66_06375 [Clostridia bacterium]|nr:hypothetical protein [Clostridia bacterium]
MEVNFGPAILIVFIMLLLIIFCTFFASRLAQLKNRSRAWGLLGFFFTIPGLIIVCFLRSKRKDNMQTNPIAYAVSKLPSPSRKTIGLLIGLAAAAVLTIIAYDNIPVMIQNYKYSKQVLNTADTDYEQPRIIEAKLTDVFTGIDSTYALTDSKDIYCWGRQLTPPIDDKLRGVIYKDALKAASTQDKLFILTNKKELLVYEKPDTLSENTEDEKQSAEFKLIDENVTDFSVSETTVGYIKSNGKLYMYGDGSYGQLGTYDRESKSKPEAVLGNVKKVVCEASFTLALQESGTAVAFGNSAHGQFGKKETAVTSPFELAENISDIAAGDDFILLLKENGAVLACGSNSHGQLGISSEQPITEFTEVLSGISSVYAAKGSSFALKENGELYAWGQNNAGQLGNGKTDNVLTPELVASGVASVSTSGLHTVILTNDGKINACGYDSVKQLGKGGPRDNFEAVVSVK